MENSIKRMTLIERVLTTRTAKKAQVLMRSKFGVTILALISFAESLLPLPIITDPFLAAAILVNRAKVRRLIFITTASSVLGGFFAFLMALFFREILLSTLSPEMVLTLQDFVVDGQNTFFLTIVGAVTPVPYTIIAWAVALTDGNPLMFILGSIVGRTFRYGLVGWCTVKFGPAALAYAKKSILLSSLAIFIFIALYVWIKM